MLPYEPALGDLIYQTVIGVIGYDHPITGQTYQLVIHQARSIPHLEQHLLFPMQAHVNDVTINEITKFLAPNTTIDTYYLR